MLDKFRFNLFAGFTLLFTLVITGFYFHAMVMADIPESEILSDLRAERGTIQDRNGRVLAVDTQMDSVEAWIPYVEDKENTARLLAGVLDLDETELLDRLSGQRRSLWIKRRISRSESRKLKELLAEESLPGIYTKTEYGRNYPEKDLAGHLLGYVGDDNIGLDGIEYYFDEVLKPEPVAGRPVFGNRLFLTIDVNIQFFVKKLISAAQEQHRADSVTMLIMDATNGDLLAYAAVPDFDPNSFQQYTVEQRLNRPISSAAAFEPGSTMKIFTLATMLDAKKIAPTDTFFCDGSYTSELFTDVIRCLGQHGQVTPADIIKYSCNAGVAYASEKITNDIFRNKIHDLGFGVKTGIPLPGESTGLLWPIEQWSARSKPTIAFGQEILVTPMQMVTAATALANQGRLLKPHLVDKIVSPEGKVLQEFDRQVVRQSLDQETAAEILKMMEGATQPGGTARLLQIPGLRIAAKTGTAQFVDPETGGYSTDVFGASCLAFFPAEEPRYIVYTIIVNPKEQSIFGGRIAAPLVGSAIRELLAYFKIPLNNEVTLEHTGVINLQNKEPLILGDTVPDLIGLSKRELLPLLQSESIKTRIEGDGWVVEQQPEAGAPITSDTVLRLKFR